jgi:hypothetical protein
MDDHEIYISHEDLDANTFHHRAEAHDLDTEDPEVFEDMLLSGRVVQIQELCVSRKLPAIYKQCRATEQELWNLYETCSDEVETWEIAVANRSKRGGNAAKEKANLEHAIYKQCRVLQSIRERAQTEIAALQQKKHDRTSQYLAHLNFLKQKLITVRSREGDLLELIAYYGLERRAA